MHLTHPDLSRIAEFNQTSRDFPDAVTLQELIEAQVKAHPHRQALICPHDVSWGGPSLTYAEFNGRVNQLARYLKSQGVGRGDIVGLLMERSLAMMVGIFATIKAGAAYLPISVDDPSDRIEYVVRDAGVRLLLVQPATAVKAPARVRALDIQHPDLYSGPVEDLPVENDPADLAYVIYTSGSTGRPKGVMIEHRSVINRLDWMQRAYPIGGTDVLLQKTSYCFDVSVWELFWWALDGASLCLLPPRAERVPLTLVETIRRSGVTVVHFVPSMLNVFLEYLEGRADKVLSSLKSLRRVFASGEALSPAHARKFNETIGRLTGARLTNLYGPTEATVDVTYYDCPADGEMDRIPIGRPIQNTRAYIVREGQQVPIGEKGELCLAGVGLARGYLNNPQLTSERFVRIPSLPEERVYRTGDLARWLPDGHIEYLGREDDQVKIRGLRIELGEIENTIRGFAGIADCAVVTRKYSESIVLIIAYIVCREEVEVAALTKYLKGQLPEYMVPSHFEKISQIPLTPNGKADRRALPEPVVRPRAAS